MTAMVAFFVGLFTGCWVAVLVMGMCIVAGRANRGRD